MADYHDIKDTSLIPSMRRFYDMGTVKFWGVMTIVRVSEIDPTPTGEIQITFYEPVVNACHQRLSTVWH